ncbi:YdeI/OmpD-associated family protein [Paenibacillus sp. MMO-177]|uniref:YdeI/OmpD-associated family protein n=1 Tax=Paenibacillus sp. MMO-177 TaxID=3081289 RepID=UPI0030175DC9
MKYEDNAISAATRAEWRAWLEANHASASSVWLIIYKKDSGVPSVYYDEAVDEALCFGWVDSKPNKRDDNSYYQFFAKRNPKSNWSKVNKGKIENLLQLGLMAPAGLAAIEAAKNNGTWDALNEVENMVIPDDLQHALEANTLAKSNFEKFPRSSKRMILEWILNAKRKETRQKRIEETVSLAEVNRRANHYRDK